MTAIAHVRVNTDGSMSKHDLSGSVGHLEGTSQLAGEFASSFKSKEWGEQAGIWHDLGKFKVAFQDYIRERTGFERDEAIEGGPGKVDHTAAGAIYAVNQMKEAGRILAYLIAGHHSGLPDWMRDEASGGSLSERLQESRHLNETLQAGVPDEILTCQKSLGLPCGKQFEPEHAHLIVRMLFSCLVDADFLDTEAFMSPEKSDSRRSEFDLKLLRKRYDQYMESKSTSAPDSSVNRIRKQILDDCRKGAELEPGFFSLTVPTGGGKTLASMGFALDHAILHGKQRIIVVIPYTSIIEQTAQVLREVFGEAAVLEHHSNLDPDRETLQSKLVTENWDAPIVVTTNVQLFESLFAARTSACRKLHNIVNSVVILDEAQMLPSEYLQPILSSLQGLVKLFGVSVVLCTATQPALEGRIGGIAGTGGFDGLTGIRELMKDRDALSKSMRRVNLTKFSDTDKLCEWSEIADALIKNEQVLCIVNSRKDCRELHALLPEGTVHLSALMCGEHRSHVIAQIKGKLKAGQAIRVVSTQLVEAGVDLDFPVVFRAMAGLDSIAQAAGRCNREGRLNELGHVFVFQPPKPAPMGLLRKGEESGKEMFRVASDAVAELSPDAFRRYFQLFYSKVVSFDGKGVMPLLAGPDARMFQIQFRTAAMKFKLIDDSSQKSIIVWYKSHRYDSQDLLETLKRIGPNRAIMRRLQRCIVNVPEWCFKSLQEQGVVSEITGPNGSLGLWAQCSPGLYDETFGLRLEGPVYQGDEFIC